MQGKLILKLVAVIGVLMAVAISYKYRNKILNSLLLLKFEASTFIDEQEELRPLLYRSFTPNIEEGEKYPLVLYLHGGGNRGQNNKAQIEGRIKPFIRKELQKEHPCYVIAPQCPVGSQWVNVSLRTYPLNHYKQADIPESDEMKMIIKLIQNYIKNYPVDENRIYVTGFSMGSSGTWDILSRYPNVFAAAVLASGVSDTTLAHKLTHIPIKAFHGEKDDLALPSLNEAMVGKIREQGGKAELKLLPNVGHNSYAIALKTPGLMEWLFNQSKPKQ